MSSYNNTPFDAFYRDCGEFFKQTADPFNWKPEQVNNGKKILVLIYLSHGDDWTEIEINKAVILINMICKRVFEIELAWADKEETIND